MVGRIIGVLLNGTLHRAMQIHGATTKIIETSSNILLEQALKNDLQTEYSRRFQTYSNGAVPDQMCL